MKFKLTERYLTESEEHFTLEFDHDNSALILKSNKRKGWIEVRGKKNYETSHDPQDKLHKLLDALDPATVSTLFSGASITLNSTNRRSLPSIEAVRKVFDSE